MKTLPTSKTGRVTLKDIAKRLDVSHATVSRALNRPEDPLISEATRERVRKMAEELRYRPNLAARSLVTGRTGLISLWLWSEVMQNAYQADVARLMHAEAQSRSYQLLVNLLERSTIEPSGPLFDAWHVDGIIAHEAGPAIRARLDGADSPPVPVVSTGAYNLLPGFDQVFIELDEGARLAMAHLLSTGRRRVVYVTDDLRSRPGDARFQAYCELMDGAGLEKEFLDVPTSRAQIREVVRTYVRERGAPEALLCHNDDIAIAAYRGLCDLGVKVPSDVALVGCDGIEDTEYLEVPITTIAQPLAEMCELACQFLDRRIEDPSLPVQEARLKARLVIRASTG